MSDVEGLTVEETTAPESVENKTPTPEAEEVVDEGKTEAQEDAQEQPEETQESEGLTDEEFERVKNDPKLKALIQKERDQAVRKKETDRRAALRHKDETILNLNKRIAELEAKEVKELDRSGFETEEEYEAAERKQSIQDALREEKLQDARAELNAQMQEQLTLAKESFDQKLEELRVNEPDIEKNLEVVADYLKMLPQEDPSTVAFRKYIAMETQLGPALANHLGKHPEIIEDQLIGKPWPIVKKRLQRIEQELSAPKEQPPAPEPLPTPLSKTKGASTPAKPLDRMSPDELLKMVRK